MCEGGGFFSVELGDSMALGQASLSGRCGSPTALSWPILPATGASVSVSVDEGVAWTADPEFSTDPFPADAAVTADCTAFTDVYSAFQNADSGLVHYAAFDEAQWQTRVQAASAQLSALAASSTSDLAAALTDMSAVVAGPRVPGNSLQGTEDAMGRITAACNANQTPFFVKAEFGG